MFEPVEWLIEEHPMYFYPKKNKKCTDFIPG
jgi:hypothetical protein